MPEERVPFEVTESTEVGDLSDVQDRLVLPPSDNVLLLIQKAMVRQSRDGAVRNLHLELKLTEGIDENGKFRGAVVFEDIPIWADFSQERIASSNYYQSKRYLVQFKYLKGAIGYDIKAPTIINDEFCTRLVGCHVKANITTENERMFDESTGGWVDTGALRNRVKAFKVSISLPDEPFKNG